MKTFLYILMMNFVFSETDKEVVKVNVYIAFLFLVEGCVALKMLDRVVTRPYLMWKFKEGTQCPMIVTPYVPAEAT